MTRSRKASKLYLRYRETTPGAEDDYDFFETTSCIMSRPKTHWLLHESIGKNGQGEYGLKTEIQGCYSTFSVKCQRLSEILYFMSFFLGKEDDVSTVDTDIYSHFLTHLPVTDRVLPTFTALYPDGAETHVMTHCLTTDFSISMSNTGNGAISATFNGICNLHRDNSGTIIKDVINTPWSTGAYTTAVSEEPLVDIRRCNFYLGSATSTEPLVHANISYIGTNLSDTTDVSRYINSITITGNNGVIGDDAMRAGGYGILNNQQRKDFTYTCELSLRKNTAVDFYGCIEQNTQQAFEIGWRGKEISDGRRYALLFIFSLIQIDNVSEDNESPVNLTVPMIVHADLQGTAFSVYAQNEIDIGYNGEYAEPVTYSINIGAYQSQNNMGAW